MDMLSPAQADRLTNGGDNFDHYHSIDRVPTHDTLRALEQLAGTTDATLPTYTARDRDDFLMVDTTSSNATVQLPRALNGREITIVKTTAPNTLTIRAYGSETINDEADVDVEIQWTSLTLKALFDQSGWVIV